MTTTARIVEELQRYAYLPCEPRLEGYARAGLTSTNTYHKKKKKKKSTPGRWRKKKEK